MFTTNILVSIVVNKFVKKKNWKLHFTISKRRQDFPSMPKSEGNWDLVTEKDEEEAIAKYGFWIVKFTFIETHQRMSCTVDLLEQRSKGPCHSSQQCLASQTLDRDLTLLLYLISLSSPFPLPHTTLAV